MNDIKYPIIHIGRHRIDSDGEGVRTLILLEGCPLRCKYCINPFTWDGIVEAEYLTAMEIYDRIKRDRPYMLATNGGITLGGGEPLLYPNLINEMRAVCDKDMTIYVETSLHVPWENIELAAENIDRFYVDIKSMDRLIYREYTGKDLELAKNNLRKLIVLRGGDSIIVRVPEIPAFANKSSQMRSEDLLRKMGIEKIDLFKYRCFDKSKFSNMSTGNFFNYSTVKFPFCLCLTYIDD